MPDAFATAERRLFDHYGVAHQSRSLRLTDPALDVAIHEAGTGQPVVLVHGSGMSAATWAPLLAHLPDRRAIALDQPGFGHSDAYSYSDRPLREHAVAQLSSTLDALGLERAPIVGTSLGAMWALYLALDALSASAPSSRSACPRSPFRGCARTRSSGSPPRPFSDDWPHTPRSPRALPPPRGMADVLGEHALARTPDEFFDVVRTGMARPGWGRAMWTHLNLAMRFGRAPPENVVTDDELRSITTPVQLIWGDNDIYGGPHIGRRAADLIPDARLDVIEGGHAPFLDDPERCATLIRQRT